MHGAAFYIFAGTSIDHSDSIALDFQTGGGIIKTQLLPLLVLFLIVTASSTIAQTNSETTSEIGRSFPGEGPDDSPFPGLVELGPMLDVSFMYTDLRNEEMDGPYGGIPQIGIGFSFATGDQTRFFLSAGYGRKSGDPYFDLDGFSDEDGLTLETIPLMFGLKFNTSSRKNFRLYLGGAFQYAFLKEKVPTAVGSFNPIVIEATGTATGYYIFLGPELPIGRHGSALGAELGYGGSKGDVRSGSHRHGVDLTGLHARVYYTFGL